MISTKQFLVSGFANVLLRSVPAHRFIGRGKPTRREERDAATLSRLVTFHSVHYDFCELGISDPIFTTLARFHTCHGFSFHFYELGVSALIIFVL